VTEPRNALTEAGAVVDRLYAALAGKDLEAARACCAPEVRIWHNFDAVAMDLEQAAQGWQGLFSAFQENRVVDVRRAALPDGIVQRHLFLLRGADGVLKGKPCCLLVKVRGGLITRLDEYIDISCDLAVDDDTQLTQGLPAEGLL